MNLTAEQIQDNWNEFLSYIDKYISEPRKTALKNFYEKYAERIMLMPAAHKKEYHNAFPGGYIEHVNRVIQAALRLNEVWNEFGVHQNYTTDLIVRDEAPVASNDNANGEPGCSHRCISGAATQ